MDNIQEYLKHLLRQEKWSPEEKAWMLEYLDKDDLTDLEQVAAEEFQADLKTMKPLLERKMSGHLLENIHREIGVSRSPVSYKLSRYRRIITAAAILVIIAGAVYFFKDSSGSGVELQEVAATQEDRKTVQLPDGSVVSLQPRSVLHFPADFHGKTRGVTLEGEAFFEVVNDADHPFVIQTHDMIITVMGTSFNVEAFPGKLSKVVVVTGRVRIQSAVSNNRDAVVIAGPGQGAVPDQATGKPELKAFSGEARYYRQRQDGVFEYKGETIAEVMKDLQKFYHSPIILQGDFSNCRFYGTIYTTDPLETSLNLVAISLNATVRKNSDAAGYTIHGGSCR